MASLAERCRPRTSLGCLYPPTEVAALRSWMACGAGPALATAAPGSGLTTLVGLLAREAAMDAVWVGCTTPRVKHLLLQAGASPVSVTLRRKIIVVDEFESFGAGDTSAQADALAFAKASPPLPVLFVSHANRSQKSTEFAKTWPRFEFGRPSVASLRSYLRTVCDKHGVSADDDGIAAVVRSTKGDLRAALNTLDTIAIGGAGRVDAESAERYAKDETADALDVVESLLRGTRGADVAGCIKSYYLDSTVVPMGVFENYLASLGAADLQAAQRAAESFSVADCLDRYMYSRQAWGAADLYAVAAVAAPVMHAQRWRVSKPSPTFGISKFGSVWSKTYNMYAKMKHVKQIAHARTEAGLVPLPVADLSILRGCMRAALDAGDDAALEKVCAWLNPAQALQLVRLGVPGAAWDRHASRMCWARRRDARRRVANRAVDKVRDAGGQLGGGQAPIQPDHGGAGVAQHRLVLEV